MEEKPRLTVGVMIFNNKGELFIMKSPKWGNKYIFPGGHVEFGEKLEDAAIREVKEETGLNIFDLKFIKLLEFIDPKEFHIEKLHFVGPTFVAKTKDERVELNKESSEYKWIKIKDALKEDLIPQNIEVIEEYLGKNTKV